MASPARATVSFSPNTETESIGPSSPTTREARLRRTSLMILGNDLDNNNTRYTYNDDEEDLWCRIMHSRLVSYIRKFINKRSRPDYVLCCVPKKNKWRKRAKTLVTSVLFNIIISALIFIHSVVLALYQPYIADDFIEANLNLVYVTIVFEFVYIIEALLRIFAAGFILHRTSYMRDLTNILDIFVIIVGFLYIIGQRDIVYETLSALMSLRLLRILIQFKSVRFILRALASSLLPLLHLGWLTLCVMIFFALFGIEWHSGNLHYGCYVNYTDNLGSVQQYLVSEFPCSESNIVGSHQCDQVENKSYCDYWPAGPNSGLVGFDNFGSALLTVFQCMTLEGWTTVLYLYDSAYGPAIVWIYFLFLIVFGSVIILNLFLGVLTSLFIGVSDRQEEHGNTQVLKERKKMEEDLKGYREWLKKAYEDEDENRTHYHSYHRSSVDSRMSYTTSDIEDEEEENVIEKLDIEENTSTSMWIKFHIHLLKYRYFVSHFVKTHFFFWFMITVIALNLLLLATDHYPAPDKLEMAQTIINYIFTAIYILEVCLKLFGLGVRRYFKSNFNKLSFALTFLNILDIVAFVHIRAIGIPVSEIVNACRGLRLISAFKYTRYWTGMKAIVNTFADIWATMLSLLGLMTVYLILFSLIGMRLFQTRLSLPSPMHPNYNSFVDASLLAFQLATTEDWHTVMYTTAASYKYGTIKDDIRWLVAIYYLISIIIGGFVLANIFLAISVDKLLEVKAVEEDITLRYEQREEKRKEREQQLLALKNPTEPSVIERTLHRILSFYSSSIRQEELKKTRPRKSKRKKQRKQLIKRSASLINTSDITAAMRRLNFIRTSSDPVTGLTSLDEMEEVEEVEEVEEEGETNEVKSKITPVKVSMKNPLTKFHESFEEPKMLRRSSFVVHDNDVNEVGVVNHTSSRHSSITSRPSLSRVSMGSSFSESFDSAVTTQSVPDPSIKRRVGVVSQTSSRHSSITSHPSLSRVSTATSFSGSVDSSCFILEPTIKHEVGVLSQTSSRHSSRPSLSRVSTATSFSGSVDSSSSIPEPSSKPEVGVVSQTSSRHSSITSRPSLSRVSTATSFSGSVDSSQSEPSNKRKFSTDYYDLIFDRSQSVPNETTTPPLKTNGSANGTLREETISPSGNASIPMSIPTPNPLSVSVGDDASIARLVRKSSLEEICPISMPGDERGTVEETHKETRRRKVWKQVKNKMSLFKNWAKKYFGSIELDPRNELKEMPNHSSFFIFAPDNRFRVWCYNIVKSRSFQTITFTVIFLSTIVLAVETPLPVPSNGSLLCTLQETIIYFDLFFLTWFLLEMALKVMSLGFILHRGSYLRGLFNIIDFFIIISTFIPLVVYFAYVINRGVEPCYSYSQQIPGVYDVFRILRVTRPIRAIRIDGLYLVTRGLVASLRRMGHVLFVGVLALIIFAVVGVHCFKGRFFYCSDFISQTEEECVGEYFVYPNDDPDCPRVFSRSWNRWDLHFDNVFGAILTLYTMLTREGWQEVMYHAIDSTGVNQGPKNGASFEALIYFILYMIGLTFFLLNLVVGFVIVTFQRVGIKSYKDSNMDRNQTNCIYISLTAHPKRIYIPKNSYHKKLYKIIVSRVLKAIVYIAVFINTTILAIQHYNMSDTLRDAIYWINIGFTVFFAVEAFLKLLILTPANYFRSSRRGFEFFIVISSILEVVLQSSIKNAGRFRYSHFASSLRVLRLNLISKHTRLITWTVLRSLEMFPWAGVLLVLVLFTYAVTGMQVFGQIMVESIDQVEVTAIHQYNNFENFGQAMLVMIRCFTGENWQRIMLGCVDADCNENSIMNSTTCGNPVTYVFFPSFFFIGSILILNIFVAIIIDNFDYYLRDKSILGSHHLTDFPSLWAKFDPMSTGKIHHTDVIRMMRSLNPPMGWGKLCPQLTAYKRMMRLNIPLSEDGMVTFNATLFAIVRQSLTIELQGEPSQVNIELKNKLKDLFPRVPKKMLDNVIPERAEDSTGRQYAAIIIQHQWRQIKLKRDRFKLYRKPSSMAFRYVPEIGRDLIQRRQTSLNLDAVLQDYSPNSSPELIHAEVHNGTYNSTPPRRQSTTSLRNSFLIRLDTIEEQNDMEESQHILNNSPPPSPDSSPPFPKETQQINLVSYPKRRQSIVSESDLFATPTGSVTSLNIQDDDPPKSKQSVHSNAFVETPV